MQRRALIVGIDEYANVSRLSGAVSDAQSMQRILERNDDGSPNYSCELLVNPGAPPITRAALRRAWNKLFDNFDGEILFYFAGHGTPTQIGGYIVTHDGQEDDWGLPMDDLLQLANQSRAKEVMLILDCCFSGSLGNPPNLQGAGIENQAQLREGVTILAASRPTEASTEVAGQGVFTDLVVDALAGGASDVRGRVSAASVYAHVEQALGPWDQRPLYKSHANHLSPIRMCRPTVSDSDLRRLRDLFVSRDSLYMLAPSYEHTDPSAHPDHVTIFNLFKCLRDAGLVRTDQGDDLYYAALASNGVRLTALGQHYYRLVTLGRI